MMTFPPESLRVIQSAHETVKARFPDLHGEEEIFLNGFMFGMRFGLALTTDSAEAIRYMKAFMGEAYQGSAS